MDKTPTPFKVVMSLIAWIKSHLMAQIKPAIRIPILLIILLNIGYVSAQTNTLEFEANEMRIVVTPDFFLIIWHESEKYGADFGLAPGELATLASCNSNTCPPAAIAAGAVAFKKYLISGVGFIVVYYNANGEVVGTSPPSTNTISYKYDALGRLIRTDYPGGIAQDFNFDPAGNRTNVQTNVEHVASYSVIGTSTTEGSNLVFTVTRAGDVSAAGTVQFTASNGSASSNDYAGGSNSISFSAGQTSKAVTVATVSDTVDEANETVIATLSAPSGGGLILESQAVGTIIDNDASPSFAVNNVSVSEGGQLNFSVTKTGSTQLVYSVHYDTSNGTAQAGTDYTAVSGTLNFSASQSSRTVTVSTIEDTAIEANETLYLNLSNASGAATISDNQGLGTINNDDTVNSPPNAVNDSYSYMVDCCTPTPDKTINPLSNDSDPDSFDTLSIISITQPPGSITASIVSSSTRIKLEINETIYNGSFTYTISDGNGGTDTATINLSIEENEL